ncbi:MAG: hypothetical protein RIT45_3061 [Pseudomonadota bacterium]
MDREPAARLSSAAPRPGWSTAALAAVAVGLLYGPSLLHGLVWDDHVALEANAALAEGRVGEWFSAPFWGEAERERVATWRPLVTVGWGVERALADALGLAVAWMHHLGNLLALWALLLSTGALARALALGRGAQVAAMVLLLCHPLLVEPVCWIVGRADLLAAAAGAWALTFAIRAQPLAATLAFAVALLCKESALTLLLPLALLASRPLSGLPLRGRLFGSLAVAAGLWFVARWAVLGTLVGPAPTAVENPLVALAGVERLLASVQVAGLGAWAVLGPGAGQADWGLGALPVAADGLALGALAAAVLAVVAAIAVGGTLRLLACAAVAPALLFAQPVLALPAAHADRLWTPTLVAAVLAVVALGEAWLRGRQRHRWVLAALLVSLPALAGAATVVARLPDWRDDAALFESVLRRAPHSYRGLVNAAGHDVQGGRLERAAARLAQAVAAAPDALFGHVAQARSAIAAGDRATAEAALARVAALGGAGAEEAELRCAFAVRFGVDDALARCALATGARRPKPLAWMWQALALDAAGRRDDAEAAFAAASRAAAPADPPPVVWRNYGVFRARHGDLDGAETLLRHALALGDPGAAEPLAALARLRARATATPPE